jgi:NADPH:quinone reductase
VRAIQVQEHGGPEVLRLAEVPEPEPGPGQVRVRVAAAGVNFIDVYFRTGAYPVEPPFVLGVEAAGTVDAVGPGAELAAEGDRVAFAMLPGAYAEAVCVPAERAVPVPDAIGFETAAALLLQGMTAHYLVYSTYRVSPGDTCLIHAAAGGMGLLLCQMACRIGARVIGTVSTEEKAALAREAGAHEVILYTEQDFVAETMRLTGNAGVQVVYDSVGRTTFLKGLDCLARCGMIVLYGQSSGPVGPFDKTIAVPTYGRRDTVPGRKDRCRS